MPPSNAKDDGERVVDVEAGVVLPQAESTTTDTSTSDDEEALSDDTSLGGGDMMSSSSGSSYSLSPSSSDESKDRPMPGPSMDTLIDEEYGTVWVPPAGAPLLLASGAEQQHATKQHTSIRHHLRPYSNSCSICLSPFAAHDVVSWSHCADCPHVFHAACIADWLHMMGRKHMQKRRRRHGNYVLRQDPITMITQTPMLCPCCRRPFVQDAAPPAVPQQHDDDEDDTQEVTNTTESGSVVAWPMEVGHAAETLTRNKETSRPTAAEIMVSTV